MEEEEGWSLADWLSHFLLTTRNWLKGVTGLGANHEPQFCFLQIGKNRNEWNTLVFMCLLLVQSNFVSISVSWIIFNYDKKNRFSSSRLLPYDRISTEWPNAVSMGASLLSLRGCCFHGCIWYSTEYAYITYCLRCLYFAAQGTNKLSSKRFHHWFARASSRSRRPFVVEECPRLWSFPLQTLVFSLDAH